MIDCKQSVHEDCVPLTENESRRYRRKYSLFDPRRQVVGDNGYGGRDDYNPAQASSSNFTHVLSPSSEDHLRSKAILRRTVQDDGRKALFHFTTKVRHDLSFPRTSFSFAAF